MLCLGPVSDDMISLRNDWKVAQFTVEYGRRTRDRANYIPRRAERLNTAAEQRRFVCAILR